MFKLLIVPLQINIAASETLCGLKETIVDENRSKPVNASTNLWSLGGLTSRHCVPAYKHLQSQLIGQFGYAMKMLCKPRHSCQSPKLSDVSTSTLSRTSSVYRPTAVRLWIGDQTVS